MLELPETGESVQDDSGGMSPIAVGFIAGIGIVIFVLLLVAALIAVRCTRRRRIPPPDAGNFETEAYVNEIYGTLPARMGTNSRSISEEHTRTASRRLSSMLDAKWPLDDEKKIPFGDEEDHGHLPTKQPIDDSDDLLDIAPELFGAAALPPSYDDVFDDVFVESGKDKDARSHVDEAPQLPDKPSLEDSSFVQEETNVRRSEFDSSATAEQQDVATTPV